MEETYTFSRALHMMRYGGKKMRSTLWGGKGWICIENATLVNYTYSYINGEHHLNKEFGITYQIRAEDIMGSWVEVKDDKTNS